MEKADISGNTGIAKSSHLPGQNNVFQRCCDILIKYILN
jgi:hypothetical protein